MATLLFRFQNNLSTRTYINQDFAPSCPITSMPSQTDLVNNERLTPLTSEQREWLKRHWGNEFEFLLAYGLSIYKDEDRLEGREIMKALIEADGESI